MTRALHRRGPRRRGLSGLVRVVVPFLVLLVASGAARAGEGPADVRWDDLSIPRGFHLDLATGRVADRAGDAESLAYRGGELVADEGAVGGLAPEEGTGVLRRGEQVYGTRWKAEPGLLLGFDLGVRGWGFLRVLEVSPTEVRLECWARSGGEPGSVRWRPRRIPARDGEAGGLALEAPGADGGPWRVEARELGALDWSDLGAWTGEVAFVDPDASSDAVREYRLVPADAEGLYGLRARGVVGVRPGGRTTPLEREDRVNVLTGVVNGERYDVTIDGATPGGLNLSPQPGVRYASLGMAELEDWTLPDEAETHYAAQRRYLPVGREFALITSEGLFVLLRAEASSGSTARLVCRANLWGERLVLPAPEAPTWTWSAEDGTHFSAADDPPAAVRDRVAGRVLERELGFESDEWVVVDRAAPGEESVDADELPEGVVRYRVSWATTRGERGPTGDAFGVLVGHDGGDASRHLLERLVEEIGDVDYEVRRRARAGLRALGDLALPQLERGLKSDDPEVAGAARELYTELTQDTRAADAKPADPRAKADREPGLEGGDETDVRGPGARELLASVAEARRLGPAPDGWLAEDADERALALLMHAGREVADEGVEAWRALLAEVDPDPAVRLVASLYPELARPESWAPVFGPEEAQTAAGLQEEALSGLDPADPWTALARLQVLHDLQVARPGTAEEAASRERGLLALRLLRRYGEGGEDVFLDAALQVVNDPRARLRAARNLFALRDRSRGSGEARTEIVLPMADGMLLRDTLEGMRNTDETDFDLILPAGDYVLDSAQLRTVRVFGDGLRIVGRGEVRIAFGLLMQDGARVVFENLELDPDGAACLRIQESDATLIGCRLRSAGQGVQVSSGVLELIDSELTDAAGRGGKGGNGIRATARSAVRISGSQIAAGGEALLGGRLALVERSCLDGGSRNAVSGMADGELLVVDSLVRADGHALHTVARGVLEGCVLLGGSAVGVQLGERFHACPHHLSSVGPEGDRNAWGRLATCPVGR